MRTRSVRKPFLKIKRYKFSNHKTIKTSACNSTVLMLLPYYVGRMHTVYMPGSVTYTFSFL